MTQEKLDEVLELNGKWRRGEPGGKRANLREADMRRANLRGADMCGADMREADMCGADMRGADMRGADLRGAKTDGVLYDEQTAFFALQCPEEGPFIAWKQADGKIIKLLVPADAKRSSATTRKCRCSKAEVLEIQNPDGTGAGLEEVRSNHDTAFVYRVGNTVEVPDFDEDRWNECSTGIHFFITRAEAVCYQ